MSDYLREMANEAREQAENEEAHVRRLEAKLTEALAQVAALRGALAKERHAHCFRTCPTGDQHEAHCDDLHHVLADTDAAAREHDDAVLRGDK